MRDRLLLLGCAALLPFVAAWPQTFNVTGRVTLVKPKATRLAADNSNAAVWLMPLDSGTDRPATLPAPRRLRLVQKRKRFEPRLLVVRVGSAVEFPNLDPFFHNVFSLFEGKRFDLGLYEAGSTRTVKFDRPGNCYIFCNIHPEMSAVVVVLETPFYGTSNRAGDITIPNVPAGRYQLQIWHERSLPEVLRALTRQITVSEEVQSFGTIRLSESGSLALAHKNKYGRDYDRPTPVGPFYEQP